jgi:anaerobic selenocysteine-containing dehydrogenase
MHNIENLVRGKARCTALMHPDDAARLGLADGATACIRSRVGVVLIPVEVTDAIMPGVVSIPHGWGHDAEGTRMQVARAHAGVNTNLLADEAQMDPLSGNAVLNGIPITIERAA